VAAVNLGTLRPSFLVTHRFAIADFARAVATLAGTAAQDGPRGKVTIEVGRTA
jgi:hypothetical protein